MPEPTETFIVEASYLSVREMTVTVKKGDDPMDPENWDDVLDENEVDFHLYETLNYKEAPDETT